jgi:hypothetical protein
VRAGISRPFANRTATKFSCFFNAASFFQARLSDQAWLIGLGKKMVLTRRILASEFISGIRMAME